MIYRGLRKDIMELKSVNESTQGQRIQQLQRDAKREHGDRHDNKKWNPTIS